MADRVSRSRTAAAAKAQHLIAYAASRRLPREAVISRFNFDPAALADVDGRVMLHSLVRYERLGFDVAAQPTSELVIDGPVARILLHRERAAVVPPTGAVLYILAGLLTLRAADLALPQPEGSRTLLAIAERHAEASLQTLPLGDDLLTARRRIVRARLPDGDLSLGELARPLGLSARTWQRRLEAEGTTLRRLLDEERRVLALHYIQYPRTPLIDSAMLQGFADHSAFTRAFSRWTLRTASDYRRALV